MNQAFRQSSTCSPRGRSLRSPHVFLRVRAQPHCSFLGWPCFWMPVAKTTNRWLLWLPCLCPNQPLRKLQRASASCSIKNRCSRWGRLKLWSPAQPQSEHWILFKIGFSSPCTEQGATLGQEAASRCTRGGRHSLWPFHAVYTRACTCPQGCTVTMWKPSKAPFPTVSVGCAGESSNYLARGSYLSVVLLCILCINEKKDCPFSLCWVKVCMDCSEITH